MDIYKKTGVTVALTFFVAFNKHFQVHQSLVDSAARVVQGIRVCTTDASS